MLTNAVSYLISQLDPESSDSDAHAIRVSALRQLQYIAKQDFGYDRAAWRRWFEDNEFTVAYQGFLTPTPIRCLRALAGEVDADSPDYLSPDEARNILSDIVGHDLGPDAETWKQFIGGQGLWAYKGRVLLHADQALLLLSGTRTANLAHSYPSRTKEEAHKALVALSDEDFGFDAHAWLVWFVETDDLDHAYKGHLRQMRGEKARRERESTQTEE